MSQQQELKVQLPATRGYQQEMLDESLRRNVVIALDTGSGKTHIAVLRMKVEMEREQKKVGASLNTIMWNPDAVVRSRGFSPRPLVFASSKRMSLLLPYQSPLVSSPVPWSQTSGRTQSYGKLCSPHTELWSPPRKYYSMHCVMGTSMLDATSAFSYSMKHTTRRTSILTT